ncbi:cupin domain-containing protein [Pricia sp.]|uniref:cupin domain-containing protein n=1 Tax=Pricia sp. TaxID=2268138 RepID=UPI0035938C44
MKRLLLLFLVTNMGFIGMAQLKQVDSGIYKWAELPTKEGNQRVGRKIMEGSSPHFSFLEIHATTQDKGAKPAPPHTQKNIEELVIVKEGRLKLTMNGKSDVLPEGSVGLIPPLTEQSMENVGDVPLTYYIMMFTSKKDMDIQRGQEAGGPLSINFDDLKPEKTGKGQSISYFERPTAMCEYFEMHVTQLDRKGPSHKPHSHVESEIIIVVEGEAEMTINGEAYQGTKGDLFFVKSNEIHGISNIGENPCRYYAFKWK